MRHAPFCFSILIGTGSIIALIAVHLSAHAEERHERGNRDHRRPVYQRRAFEWRGDHGDRRGRGHSHGQWMAPQVNAGWFQRPYPYHLDYYKMRYGGSYAPYFGNLYGPPQVVTAPPYYGPYYGGFGYGEPNGYGPAVGYGAMPYAQPGYPNGVVYEAPVENATPKDSAATPPAAP